MQHCGYKNLPCSSRYRELMVRAMARIVSMLLVFVPQHIAMNSVQIVQSQTQQLAAQTQEARSAVVKALRTMVARSTAHTSAQKSPYLESSAVVH